MFIELAEVLRCPRAHEGTHFCVLVPREMRGRDVVTGDVACPVCGATYPILDGVADMRHPDDIAPVPQDVPASLPSSEDVAALLGVHGPGGYAVLVGSAGQLVDGLAVALEGVHLVLVNPPQSIRPAEGYSYLVGGRGLPLGSSVARGVVLGAEHATDPWVREAVRLLLRGLRLVVLRENVEAVGISTLASGQGMTLGVRD
jgi:uncharacterized protein YbaR (Trm112 family)